MRNRDLLLDALKNGNAEAFTVLYRENWKQVYNFTRLYISNYDTAEEIVQDVFVKVWESREFLKEDGNINGLLFITTRNIIFNKFKKKINEDIYKMTVLSAMQDSYNIEDEIDAKDLSAYIDQLIDELPPQRRKVFNLSRKEYKSYKEIAEQLNISEKTVERHINESLKYIRRNLALLFIFYINHLTNI